MLTPTAERASIQVRDALAGAPGLRSVFVNGSHVAGAASERSDVDFTVLVADEPHVATTVSALAKRFPPLGDSHEVPHFAAVDGRIAVCIYPQPWTDAWVGNAFRSADDLRQWQGWLRHKVVDAVAVYGPEDVLARYQAALAHYPAALAEQIAREALAYLRTEFLDDWNFRNPYHFAYCLREMLEQIGLALFACHQRFYAPPLKHWQRDLRELRPPLMAELDSLMALSADTDLGAKRGVLARVIASLEAAVP